MDAESSAEKPKHYERLERIARPAYWQALAAIGEHFAAVCAPDTPGEGARLMIDSAAMLWQFAEDPPPALPEVDALLNRWEELEADVRPPVPTCMTFLKYALEEFRDPDYRHAATEYSGALSSIKARDILSGMYDPEPPPFTVVRPGQLARAQELMRTNPELRREDAYLDRVISLAEEADQAGRPLRRDDVLQAVRDLDNDG